MSNDPVIMCECGTSGNRVELLNQNAIQHCHSPNSKTKFVVLIDGSFQCIKCFDKEYEAVFPDC